MSIFFQLNKGGVTQSNFQQRFEMQGVTEPIKFRITSFALQIIIENYSVLHHFEVFLTCRDYSYTGKGCILP
jgi:hypothetical protein